jgi:hypothetical protein
MRVPKDSLCTLRLLICRHAVFFAITPLGPEMQRPPRGAAFHERQGVQAFTRCRVRAGYCGRAGSRRSQDRRHKAPSAPTQTIQETNMWPPRRATRLRAHRNLPRPQYVEGWLSLWTCYPQVQTRPVTYR